MGIPHLITFLRPYAVQKSLAEQDVVIDGPGLAYHIHHVCLSARTTANSPFDAAPSYSELAETVVAWLDHLRRIGANVKKIYFDGFLPPSKFKTRSDRIASYTKKLIEYQSIYQTYVPYRPSLPVEDQTQYLFARRTVRPQSTQLPAVSFLVPAILEALLASENYRAMTEIVPGEADLYCARFVKTNGGIVLTGDSDLLVHDLGPEGTVTFFREIEINSEVPTTEGLLAQVYHPTAIANRLSLAESHGIQALAFEIIMDSHASFRSLLRDAVKLKSIKEHEKIYQEFVLEYKPLQTKEVPLKKRSSDFEVLLRCLHPRISECVLQFPHLAQLAGQQEDATSRGSAAKEIHVFLSFLLDCPVRTNAWEMSRSVRQLAYGLLNLIVPTSEQTFTVYEHRRQQKESNGRALQLPQVSELPEACMVLIDLIEQIRGKLPQHSSIDLWTAVAVYQDIELASSQSKVALSQTLFQSGQEAKVKNKLSWELIHFIAQLQGSFYSFIMLTQVASLVIAYKRFTAAESVPEYLEKLLEKLKLLPPLNQIQEIDQVSSIIQKISAASMVEAAEHLLGITTPKQSQEPSEKKKKSKKKRKRDQATEQAQPRSRSNNPFDILDAE